MDVHNTFLWTPIEVVDHTMAFSQSVQLVRTCWLSQNNRSLLATRLGGIVPLCRMLKSYVIACVYASIAMALHVIQSLCLVQVCTLESAVVGPARCSCNQSTKLSVQCTDLTELLSKPTARARAMIY